MFSKEEAMRRVYSMPSEEFKKMVYKCLDEAGVEYVKGGTGFTETFGKLERPTLEDWLESQKVDKK